MSNQFKVSLHAIYNSYRNEIVSDKRKKNNNKLDENKKIRSNFNNVF